MFEIHSLNYIFWLKSQAQKNKQPEDNIDLFVSIYYKR